MSAKIGSFGTEYMETESAPSLHFTDHGSTVDIRKTYSSFEKALAIIPKITGSLSFIFSLYIVQHVLRSRKKRGKTYHRLLLGMSLCDMVGSFFGFVLSTAPMPVGSTFGAIGSLRACSIAGFFNQAGNACTPLYNGSLATYYFCVIVLGWKDKQINGLEPYLHIVPLVFGWGTAIAGYALNLYAPANWVCWIAPYPSGCKDTYTYGLEGNCERGDNAGIYRMAFLYVEVWIVILYTALLMSLIYIRVLRVEQSTNKYRYSHSFSDSPCRSSLPGKTDSHDRSSSSPINVRHNRKQIQQNKKQHSQEVANQAMAYVGAFFLTWIFGTTARMMQLAKTNTNPRVNKSLLLLQTIFFPLQGFFNALVYLRPRYNQYCEAHKTEEISWCTFYFLAIWTGCSKKDSNIRSSKYSTVRYVSKREHAQKSLKLSGQESGHANSSIVPIHNEEEIPNSVVAQLFSPSASHSSIDSVIRKPIAISRSQISSLSRIEQS